VGFFTLYSLEAFLLFPAQEEFNKYIAAAHLGLEFQKKKPNQKPKTFSKYCCSNCFGLYPVLSRGFDYPSTGDRNNYQNKLGIAAVILISEKTQ